MQKYVACFVAVLFLGHTAPQAQESAAVGRLRTRLLEQALKKADSFAALTSPTPSSEASAQLINAALVKLIAALRNARDIGPQLQDPGTSQPARVALDQILRAAFEIGNYANAPNSPMSAPWDSLCSDLATLIVDTEYVKTREVVFYCPTAKAIFAKASQAYQAQQVARRAEVPAAAARGTANSGARDATSVPRASAQADARGRAISAPEVLRRHKSLGIEIEVLGWSSGGQVGYRDVISNSFRNLGIELIEGDSAGPRFPQLQLVVDSDLITAIPAQVMMAMSANIRELLPLAEDGGANRLVKARTWSAITYGFFSPLQAQVFLSDAARSVMQTFEAEYRAANSK